MVGFLASEGRLHLPQADAQYYLTDAIHCAPLVKFEVLQTSNLSSLCVLLGARLSFYLFVTTVHIKSLLC